MDVFSDTGVVNAVFSKVPGKKKLKTEFRYLNNVGMEELFYVSDGLKVKAYLAYPNDKRKHQAITRVNEICKTTPILLLHGTADWRVMPEKIAQAFLDSV